MKLKNKFLLCVFLLFLIVSINGCKVSQDKKDIYNDDSKIAQQGDSFSFMTRIDTEDSNDKIDIKYRGFYGTDTIWTLESKQEGEVAFEYNSIVSSGDFKAVVINPKNEIETILTGNKQGNKTLKLENGKYIFKIVGRNAKGEVKISFNGNQKVKIVKQTDHK